MTVHLQPCLFGSSLVTALARHSTVSRTGQVIPTLLIRLYAEIERRGLDEEGIFRRSGSLSVIRELQAEFERANDIFQVDLTRASVHTLTGLFKRFLQHLPEPVIPLVHQPAFLSQDERIPTDIRILMLKKAIRALPHEHQHLLLYLIHVADQVCQHSSTNHMSHEALAIIFAPTCVRLDAFAEPSRRSSLATSGPAPSTISLPEAPTQTKRLRALWSNLRQKKQTAACTNPTIPVPCTLHDPRQVDDPELIKISRRWTCLFEFMIRYAAEVTSIHPTKSSPRLSPLQVDRPVFTKRPHRNSVRSLEPALVNLYRPVDFNALEFPESAEIVRQFDALELELKPQKNETYPAARWSITSPMTTPSECRLTTSPKEMLAKGGTKYTRILRHWRAREQQDGKQSGWLYSQPAPSPSTQSHPKRHSDRFSPSSSRLHNILAQSTLSSDSPPWSPPPLASDWIKALCQHTGIQTKPISLPTSPPATKSPGPVPVAAIRVHSPSQ